MGSPLFMEEIAQNGVARITLTRPDLHNAFNDVLISELTMLLHGLESDERVRIVALAAQGKSFSAGADLNWMKSMADYSHARNLEDSNALAELLWTLDRMSKPTVALVQGPAYGGGVGLIACCDIAIAAEEALFCLSEVRLGLIPAAISPYIVAKVGISAARRYALSGERFSAWEAHRIGLVHEVTNASALETVARELFDSLLAGGPEAMVAAKDLLFEVEGKVIDQELREETARRIARIRVTREGQEGVKAFLEKRRPSWVPK